jgi:hypothetical protein
MASALGRFVPDGPNVAYVDLLLRRSSVSSVDLLDTKGAAGVKLLAQIQVNRKTPGDCQSEVIKVSEGTW